MNALPVQGTPAFVGTHPRAPMDVVKNVALACLQEFSVSLALNLTVACFVTTSVGLTLIINATVTQLAISILFHVVGAYAKYNGHEQTASFCEWITGANFTMLTGFNAQSLIHESGHALAALALYKKAYPQIEIYPFAGGITQFYKSTLSDLGKKIGPVAATCAVIVSGPALTLLVSSVLLAVGLLIRHTQPELAKYLIIWSGIDFFYHAQYALSALHTEQWKLSHDFVHLSVFGLNPIAASVAILAIPIVIGVGVYCFEKKEPPMGAALN